MLKKIKNRNSGITLVEILFAVTIFTIIAGALAFFLRNIFVYNSFISYSLANTNTGKQIMKTMTAEIRTAGTANTGAYTISLATAEAFTFYSDIDGDELKERVRYFMTGTTLQKGIIKPTGSPLSYNPANEQISTLAYNLTNSSIFEYYDKNYDGTTAPLSIPVNIPNIRLVKISISIEQDPNHSPVPMTFSTQVSIRNLKDNL
ncbi:hypothetical protein A3D42_02345 [Candidatus Nomurabacteria bacterium RIFCSPHIGHO2_02_FULL_41_18]|uniref:Type II secretion system protein J n=1 Tax=Candidatus Nomurabacteria bacterium RIFCSPHIGHO2_02_FULL_41_18 TaxID=1801754 RepID=A0A1F6W4W1_9BACT|nr:MAG: hypothetical protein A2737_01930 [Candidatus Nomurabacteria bacterium RIFCSPHIGHO2_01_FULL_41_71]OGI76950.1 MAG: hypothetical protein A3D42_02345 [Candidatus Nomurabacteria bacterium RIFCSPHIGHO2_02_FULL_41_18]OGI89460.1 MAG: hypothetical protein A3B01_01050 [Candidatus Nomurabacteria bacterium RIFCSPLOWO2_01_FULL_41_52b]